MLNSLLEMHVSIQIRHYLMVTKVGLRVLICQKTELKYAESMHLGMNFEHRYMIYLGHAGHKSVHICILIKEIEV